MTTAPTAPPRPAATARTPVQGDWFHVEYTPGQPGRERAAITPVDFWVGHGPPHRPVAGTHRGRRLEATPADALGPSPVRIFVRGDRMPLAGPCLTWSQIFALARPSDDAVEGRDFAKLLRAGWGPPPLGRRHW